MKLKCIFKGHDWAFDCDRCAVCGMGRSVSYRIGELSKGMNNLSLCCPKCKAFLKPSVELLGEKIQCPLCTKEINARPAFSEEIIKHVDDLAPFLHALPIVPNHPLVKETKCITLSIPEFAWRLAVALKHNISKPHFISFYAFFNTHPSDRNAKGMVSLHFEYEDFISCPDFVRTSLDTIVTSARDI